MKRLGAIIAGGQSRRFGSDKAAVMLNGKALIDHVADGLRPQVDVLIVVGREWKGLVSIPDMPKPQMGPLGGLCAALEYAENYGFDLVLTSGCDTLPVANYQKLEADHAPSVVLGQRLSGVWPSLLYRHLRCHLTSETNWSVRHWMAICGAAEVDVGVEFHNLNRIADLSKLSNQL
jgi:molybdenum cofactor guanylyltransferase